MSNAKKELLGELKDLKTTIECVKITIGDYYEKNKKFIILKKEFTDFDYNVFLQQLDFEYDSGYGEQELFGYVWLKDGTWLERHEYDGSEWWTHKVRPEIPEELF